MSRGKELIKNTSILMLAKLSTQVVSFVLLPLYTAILSTVEYGRVDVYTSLAMIVIPFITLQVEMALFRYFIGEKDIYAKKEIVSSAITIVLFTGVLATVVFFILNYFLKFPYSGFLYAYYFVMTLNTVMLQMCRAEGDNVGYAFATFISSALAVVLNVLFVAILRFGVEGMLASSILAHFISSIFMVFRTGIINYFSLRSVSKKQCKRLLSYSTPLIFNQVASWAINYSDRLIILNYLGENFNGIYSVACKFSNILNTFLGVYNIAWTENVIRSAEDKDGNSYISDVFNLTFNLYMMLITGIINILPFFYDFLVNKSFKSGYNQVPILLIGMMFSGMAATVGSIYIAYNKTKEVSVTTMIAGVINVVVHLVLLKKVGLYAASISTLVSFAILFFYRLYAVKTFFPLHLSLKKIAIQTIILIISWVAYAIKNPICIMGGLLLNILNIAWLVLKNKDVLLDLRKSR